MRQVNSSAGMLVGAQESGGKRAMREWGSLSLWWGERPREPDLTGQTEGKTARPEPRPSKVNRYPGQKTILTWGRRFAFHLGIRD
jgi:hypothetical protein